MSRLASQTLKKTPGLWPLFLLLFALPAQAQLASGSFTAVTYNVAGLPQALAQMKGLDPNTNMGLIALELNSETWEIVALQEAFVHGDGEIPPGDPGVFGSVGPHYYNQLMGGFTPNEFQFPPADTPIDPALVASGLGRRWQSNLPFSSLTLPLLACEDASNDPTKYCRQRWDMLVGADDLSDKGYAFSQHTLAPGVTVDVYNWHAQAGGSEFAERADNTQQLILEINTRSAGNAVIVLGDTNSTYDRNDDVIRDMLVDNGQDLPLKDAWNELVRGILGLPIQGNPAIFPCDEVGDPAERPRMDWAGPNCEWRDKIFYRSSAALTLTATDYFVVIDYMNGMGDDFSDHYPTGVVFDYQEVPEPSGAVFTLAALSALGVLRVKRSRRQSH